MLPPSIRLWTAYEIHVFANSPHIISNRRHDSQSISITITTTLTIRQPPRLLSIFAFEKFKIFTPSLHILCFLFRPEGQSIQRGVGWLALRHILSSCKQASNAFLSFASSISPRGVIAVLCLHLLDFSADCGYSIGRWWGTKKKKHTGHGLLYIPRKSKGLRVKT